MRQDTLFGLRTTAECLGNPRYVRDRTDHTAHPASDGIFLSTLRVKDGPAWRHGYSLRVDWIGAWEFPPTPWFCWEDMRSVSSLAAIEQHDGAHVMLWANYRDYIGGERLCLVTVEDFRQWLATHVLPLETP